ncbi:MAG: N-6 DNA methylase [Burkholderiaceae bacterium]|jgi:hypothetical protein|nr:N-6 DNA methylase [Burkholderiaceae bacterium]
MTRKFVTAPHHALEKLLELVRSIANSQEDALLYALSWLAAGKLVTTGRLPGVGELNDFLTPRGWSALSSYLGESISRPGRWHAEIQHREAVDADAFAVVSNLVSEHGLDDWKLQDAAWNLASRSRSTARELAAFDPNLCDLLVGALDAGPADLVWIPFDWSGQFTIRVIRAGATVWHAGWTAHTDAVVRLLLALEEDAEAAQRVTLGKRLGGASPTFTRCVVAAPMNMRMDRPNVWEDFERLPRHHTLFVEPHEFDRSDAWAIAAIWPAVRSRGVFITAPNLLFAQGQEQRLRHALIRNKSGNQVRSVFSLPQGLLTHTNIAVNALVLDTSASRSAVRMVDAAGQVIDGVHKNRFGRDIGVKEALRLYLSDDPVPQLAELVSLTEISDCDYSLVPSRYTRRVISVGEDRTPLGDLVLNGVIRSPAPAKEFQGVAIWEVGIPLLDRWRPIEGIFEKSTRLSPKKSRSSLLRSGDVVISIKGSIGKVGIVGDLDSDVDLKSDVAAVQNEGDDEEAPSLNAAVVAPSCIGLRPDTSKILPEYLLLYLRSDDFKQQLEALRVGATIAHVTPSALLSSVLVPVPPIRDQAALVERYWELRDLEKTADEIQSKMNDMRSNLFSRKAEPQTLPP